MRRDAAAHLQVPQSFLFLLFAVAVKTFPHLAQIRFLAAGADFFGEAVTDTRCLGAQVGTVILWLSATTS